MKYRMDKTLKFWIKCEYEMTKHLHRGVDNDEMLVSILREFEVAGDAMRYRDIDGNIVWKATPKMLENLADAELEAEDELEDDL
jgi:hypothetical protein